MKVHIFLRCVPKEIFVDYDKINSSNIQVAYCGYLEVYDVASIDVYDYCNWSCWSTEIPDECSHLTIGYCNSDMAYCVDDKYYSHWNVSFDSAEDCYKELTNPKSEFFSSVWPTPKNCRIVSLEEMKAIGSL